MSSHTRPVNVAALQQLDRTEWAATYDCYVSATFTFLAHLVGGQRTLAEELHQETWLTAMSAIEQFAPERGEFRQWLFGIARKRVALYFRSATARKRGTSQEGENAGQEFVDDRSLLPGNVMEEVERFDAVRAAMAELGDDARDALLSKYVDNLSVAEIAAKMGKTPKSVESLLSRSRTRMRELLRWYFPHSMGVAK